jgi:hypothetical protein
MQQRSSWRRGQADITDLRLTLSTQLMQTNPVTAAERLVAQTATDAATQAARGGHLPDPEGGAVEPEPRTWWRRYPGSNLRRR